MEKKIFGALVLVGVLAVQAGQEVPNASCIMPSANDFSVRRFVDSSIVQTSHSSQTFQTSQTSNQAPTTKHQPPSTNYQLPTTNNQLALGTPFADGAVLQREKSVPVWGTAKPGDAVGVSFAGQKKSAVADGQGRWRVNLDPMPASSVGRTLSVTAGGGALSVTNVLVGEVWFASGQSNMDCPLWKNGHSRYRDGKGAMMTMMTHLPLIRYVKCPHEWSVEPRPYRVRWHAMTRRELEDFGISAVAFYYARELYLALGVPVGIVDASWGGTNIDAWTPRCGYENCDPSIRDAAEWKVRADFDAKKDKAGPIDGTHQQPTTLFNGMVAAWTPMAMRGFIWYQGCHNALRGESVRYCAKMHALYDGWSRAFENPNLRLYFAQLAPYGGGWLQIAGEQNRFAAEEPNAAISVLSDVGNRRDIHPNDKETVAQRLALHALRRNYGFDIPEDDAPTFKSVTVDTNGFMTLRFDHVKSWYVYTPDYSKAMPFDVAGTNGVWQRAKIVNFRPRPQGKWADEWQIDAPELVIASEEVPEPVAVRYMASGESGMLYADTSLPLGPFAAAAGGGGSWDGGRLLVEAGGGSKALRVADNLVWLEAGRVPDYAVGNVIRWLELHGINCASYRARYKIAEAKDGEPLAKRPDFRLGYMLDISRDKVPTMAALKRLVDALARFGYNELQLYTEVTFAYSGHEEMWHEWSPMTAAEIRELDDYCWNRGIVLTPNQNSFGHLEKLFRHKRYLPLAEAPDGFTITNPPLKDRPPKALHAAAAESMAFLGGLYDELFPLFRHADRVNVGCDEVWDIFSPTCRSAAKAKQFGVSRVYADHLKGVYGLCSARKRRMEFWADMMLWEPKLLNEIPKDALPINWGYGGEDKDAPGYTCEFEGRCIALKRQGLDFYVAPSTCTWMTFFGRHRRMRANLDMVTAAARKYGACGLLLTCWGDRGHRQPWLVDLPGIVYTAAKVRGEEMTDEEIAAAIDGFCGCRVGKAVIALGNVDRGKRRNEDNPTAEMVAEVRAALAQADLKDAPDWVRTSCETFAFGVDYLEAKAGGTFAAKRDELAGRYAELWKRDNRTGGLEASMRELDLTEK